MDEDTRKLILRIQGEDLAALWAASNDNNSEVDATLRVYRRQLSLLDRHLENTRQARTTEGAVEAANHSAVTIAHQITDIDAPILTEDGDVYQVRGVNPRPETRSLSARATSFPKSIVATTVRSLPQLLDRPVVRLPPSAPTVGEQVDKILRDEREAVIRGKQAEEVRREAGEESVIGRMMDALRNTIGTPQTTSTCPLACSAWTGYANRRHPHSTTPGEGRAYDCCVT
jgi:hypothetical protein